jgi:taurine dioxygenase
MPSRITHRPLAPFAVEADVDRRSGLSPDDEAELRRLYQLEGLLVLRGQQLTMNEQIDLCSVFGPVLRDSRENYVVSNVRADALLGSKALLFHNDVPFVPLPYLGGSLHAIDVDEGVSATRFASGFRAYQRLPLPLRERVDGLNALQLRKRVEGRRTRLVDLRARDVAAVHPVVGHQAATGRPYLFVNEDMTGCIIGMTEAESDELLEQLFSYLYDEDDVYQQFWRNGDIVIWDNLALQHARHEVAPVGNRTLQRVTIAELGFYDQIPYDVASYEKLRTVPQPA